MWPELGWNPHRWDDERFKALKIRILNHSATGAAITNLTSIFTCNVHRFISDHGPKTTNSPYKKFTLLAIEYEYMPHVAHRTLMDFLLLEESSRMLKRLAYNIYEPRHDKTNKMSVRPAKTRISLGIRPVWSESSMSAWRNLGSLATHWAHSKDPDQTGRMPRLIWVFAGRTLVLLVLSCRGSYINCLLW